MMHNDVESLHKEISKELLPKELGGTRPESVDELNG